MLNVKKLYKIEIAICFALLIIIGCSFRVSAAETELKVTYNTNISCNEPVTFTMEAVGYTGDVRYYFNDVKIYHTYDDGTSNTWSSVFDPSRFTYTESNTRTFTFMASGSYWLKFRALQNVVKDADGNIIAPAKTMYKDVYITINDPDYPSVETIVQTLKTQCLASGATTDYEKALWFHDWIIHHMEYDAHGKQHKTDNEYMYVDAEGALTARALGVCESYHRGLRMLLNSVGIETARIEGNGHVWTGAKLDGTWCHIDATWDDIANQTPNAYNEHLYFGLDDRITKIVHDQHSYNEATSPYNSLKNHYLIKENVVDTWTNEVMATIETKLTQSDAEELTFDITQTNGLAYGYFKVIYNLVASEIVNKTINIDGITYTITSASYADNPYPNLNGEMSVTLSKSEPQHVHSFSSTWSSDADYHWHTCTVPGCTETDTKIAHNLKTKIVKATPTENGYKRIYCPDCAYKKSKTNIYAVNNITLSATSYIYDGKEKKPSVTVLTSKGAALTTAQYTLTYSSGRTNVGKYKVTIALTGKYYTGSTTLSYKILPPRTDFTSATGQSKALYLKWTKLTTQVTGYDIQYSTVKDFSSNSKMVTITPNTTYKTSIKSLDGKTTYYVRIRAYHMVGTTKYAGKWSAVHTVKTLS